jgi:RNA polymerase sigma-70 factor (ECF subfamily)
MDRIIELYQLHREAIFGYLLRMTGSRDDAAELTQETFYQACLSLYRFKGESSLRTWLFSIARNVYLKWLRDNRRRTAELRQDADADSMDGTTPADPTADALVLKEERERVRLGLAMLPENARTILILKEYQQLSYQEIAEIFGQTVNWARVAFYRAKKQLRQFCRELEDDHR